MGKVIVCRNCRTPAKVVQFDPFEAKYCYRCDTCDSLVRIVVVNEAEETDERVAKMRSLAYRAVESAWKERKLGRETVYSTVFGQVSGVNVGDFYRLTLQEARTVAFAASRLGVEGLETDENH